MSVSEERFNGDHYAITYNGMGTGLTNVPRNGIALGIANEVIINDGSGALSSEPQLATSRGGTGINTSASNGTAKVTAGVWSIGPISPADIGIIGPANQAVITDPGGLISTEAQLIPLRGGTGLNTSASTGIAKVNAGTWSITTIVNADVSPTAAIDRSKIADGTPNQIVVNDGTGALSSTSTVPVANGGTGQDFSSVGAGPFIITNSSGVFSSSLEYSVTASPNSVVQRDGAGNINLTSITVTSVSTDTLTSTGDITINPAGGDVIFSDTVINQTPSTIPGGNSAIYTTNVQTVGATTGDLFTLPTVSGTSGTVYSINGMISAGDLTGGILTTMLTFQLRGKNLIGVTTLAAPIQVGQSADAGFAAATFTETVSGTNIIIRVNGIAGLTINWCGRFEVVSQEF